MNICDAIELVLALARANMTPGDIRAEEACDTLEDFAVNELGDD